MTTKISGDNISSIANTGVTWNAVTVADGSTQVNATSGNGYLLDTNAGVIEVFLPTSPTRGDTIVLADYSGTFATNRVIVNTGGVLIDSSATGDVQLTTNNIIAEFVYIDSAKGWLVKLNQAAGTTPSSALTGYSSSYDTEFPYITATGGTITTSGDYKIHTFTGDGCFVVSKAGLGTSAIPSIVDYLVVAGGGGGGLNGSGGAGAGGFRESKAATSPTHTASPHTASPLAATTGITITATTYPITVGGGGSGAIPAPAFALHSSGSPSIFSTITSAGGGYGGDQNSNCLGAPASNLGGPGGSGGGGRANTSASGGSGNTPPVAPPQGNNGGSTCSSPNGRGGGGGGATAVGETGSSGVGGATGPGTGAGGNGATTSISGSPTSYSGGGGGGHNGCSFSPSAASAGGTGGGGAGGVNNVTAGVAATANTGGGGGGGSGGTPSAGAAGGKGIVILRYKYQ